MKVEANIQTKVNIEAGLITAEQIHHLVECGVAEKEDFTQRKQYNEFYFSGDKDAVFVTTWDLLKSIRCFTVTIDHDSITIK